MTDTLTYAFTDNPVIKGREGHYKTITIDVAKVVKSWRESLFSYEWMLPDGRIKGPDELSENEKPKRAAVEDKIRARIALETPVLGIGLMDNVEIGTGRATLLTLAAHGAKTMPAHIPLSHEDEFKPFLAK